MLNLTDPQSSRSGRGWQWSSSCHMNLTIDAEEVESKGSFYHNSQDAVVSAPSRYILILLGGWKIPCDKCCNIKKI